MDQGLDVPIAGKTPHSTALPVDKFAVLNDERSDALGLAAERGGSAVNPSEVAECSFHGGLLSVVMYGTQDNREGPKPFVVRGCNPLPFLLPFLLGGGSLFARSVC